MAIDLDRPTPSRFFLNCNDGISPSRVKALVKKHGKDILIGIDPGMTDRPEGDSADTIEAVKAADARLHVYLVGPGMLSWSDAEAEQVKFLAGTVGIDTSKKNWHDKWKNGGWEEKAFEQFSYYFNEHEAYSCEIDNLDSSNLENDWDEYIAFYKRFSERLMDVGVLTKIMLKNIDEDGLRKLKKVIDAGEIDRLFFANWGMFEEGTGDPEAQIEVCKEMGIVACTPISGITETHAYGVVNEGVAYP